MFRVFSSVFWREDGERGSRVEKIKLLWAVNGDEVVLDGESCVRRGESCHKSTKRSGWFVVDKKEDTVSDVPSNPLPILKLLLIILLLITPGYNGEDFVVDEEVSEEERGGLVEVGRGFEVGEGF